MEEVTLIGGQVITAHELKDCRQARMKQEYCCIHYSSDHHMLGWPQNWREDKGQMERVCPHGIGHPDPDDLYTDTVHGCDGCCKPPENT